MIGSILRIKTAGKLGSFDTHAVLLFPKSEQAPASIYWATF